MVHFKWLILYYVNFTSRRTKTPAQSSTKNKSSKKRPSPQNESKGAGSQELDR
jgi:hypothetical protein